MDDPVAALETAVRRFGEAWARGDMATLDALLSPSYIHTDAYGKTFDRAGWLAYAAHRAGRKTQITFDDLRIRLVGNTGIVTGINRLRGDGITGAGGGPDLALRFTQIWMFRSKRWLREIFQATPIAGEPGPFA